MKHYLIEDIIVREVVTPCYYSTSKKPPDIFSQINCTSIEYEKLEPVQVSRSVSFSRQAMESFFEMRNLPRSKYNMNRANFEVYADYLLSAPREVIDVLDSIVGSSLKDRYEKQMSRIMDDYCRQYTISQNRLMSIINLERIPEFKYLNNLDVHIELAKARLELLIERM